MMSSPSHGSCYCSPCRLLVALIFFQAALLVRSESIKDRFKYVDITCNQYDEILVTAFEEVDAFLDTALSNSEDVLSKSELIQSTMAAWLNP